MDANAEKRVALAKDVMAKLVARAIIPYFGAYALVDRIGCHTCALGSLMVACCGAPEHSIGSDPDELISCLSPLFSIEELATIEAAFEGTSGMPLASEARHRNGIFGADFETRLDAAVDAFGPAPDEGDEGFEDAAANRIHDIMLNIVKRDGRFVPEEL